MSQQTKVFCYLLTLSLILFSCKKSNSSKFELGSLNLTGVYGLVIPQDTSSITKLTSAKILYKLTSSDTLAPLEFLNVDGFNMNGYYAPEYFYQLNGLYFLATFSVINSNPKVIESFIIKYSDGKAFKLPSGFYPMKSAGGAWIQEPSEKPVKAGPNNSYYFRGEDRIFKITQTALDLFDTQVIDISGTSADVFDVDSEGDIMVGSKIYTSPTTFYKSNVYSASNSDVSSSFSNGFSIVKLINNQIQTFHIYVQGNQLKEDTLSVIADQGNGWLYRGSYKFSDPSQLIHVFDKGLVRVNASGASLIVFSNLALTSIELADQSTTHLFLAATTNANEKVLLEVTPANDPASFSQIFAPDQYLISHFNVLGNDNLMFQATDIVGNIQVFDYYSSSVPRRIINYQNITARQLITIQ